MHKTPLIEGTLPDQTQQGDGRWVHRIQIITEPCLINHKIVHGQKLQLQMHSPDYPGSLGFYLEPTTNPEYPRHVAYTFEVRVSERCGDDVWHCAAVDQINSLSSIRYKRRALAVG